MSNTNEANEHTHDDKRPRKRSLGDVMARRREQLEALRAKAAIRRQKEREIREALMREMAQLKAKERRRQREIEAEEARAVVRHLGTLALDALIHGQEVGGAALALDWTSIAAERLQVVERVVRRGRSQGGMGAADMTADPSESLPPEADIDIRLDDAAI